ncbi:hypothetical protein C482_18342 [Natrialba chahannaoensis JCM 10990]|uniref:Uncharacterized protein n=2 Tax=Natrialba chahannaoensis TaxID=68911 RepID=M0A6A7_9EURY|nr:hypothetical protein C482_18342 [Natrialba chahannaoensis JCM 10990]
MGAVLLGVVAGCLSIGPGAENSTDGEHEEVDESESETNAEDESNCRTTTTERVYLRGEFVSESERPDDKHVYDSDDDRFDGVELFEVLFNAAREITAEERSDGTSTVTTIGDGGLTGVAPDDDRATAAEAAYHAEPAPPTDALYVEDEAFVLRVRLHREQDEAEQC